ncbi:MAG: hypothetical protein HYT81_10460 [Gemmatimonadetes bacterium]|nr:hypothetical protein [Gemmatimonadota bacterium]
MTVGYQRIKGLREQGQRRSGEYEASKSRTLPVSLTKLYRAFSQPRLQSQWLPDVTLAVRSATPNKYIHITWEDGTVQGPGGGPAPEAAKQGGGQPDEAVLDRAAGRAGGDAGAGREREVVAGDSGSLKDGGRADLTALAALR